jgi:hypothetical protein
MYEPGVKVKLLGKGIKVQSGGLVKVASLRNETLSKFVIVSEISKTIW